MSKIIPLWLLKGTNVSLTGFIIADENVERWFETKVSVESFNE